MTEDKMRCNRRKNYRQRESSTCYGVRFMSCDHKVDERCPIV